MLQYDNLFYFSLKTNPTLNPDKPPRALQVDVRALSCSTKGTPAQLRFQARALQS